MKKTALIFWVVLLGVMVVSAQEATVQSMGGNWQVTGGGSNPYKPLISLSSTSNTVGGGGVIIKSGFNYSSGTFNYGDLSLYTYGSFSAKLEGSPPGSGKVFSFTRSSFGQLTPVKFGIGTENPIRTLHLDNLSAHDGIRFEDMFQVRRSDLSNNNFVMENIATDGNLYIRSRKDSNITGDLFLNDLGGNVGIGTVNTHGFKLGVNGNVVANEVKVAVYPNWSDFVFEKNYDLPTLQEVEKHIEEEGHLKNIPSADEVAKNGFFLGDMNAKLLQKIEELTLYTIEQEKKIQFQAKSFEVLQNEIELLKKQLELLKNK